MRLSFRMISRRLAMAALVTVLASCHEAETSVPTDTPPPPSGNAGLAVADLAKRLGISENRIEVLAEEDVTWRDGSIGCPREGMMYTQALVEGSRIVLRAEGREFAYHSGRRGQPFYCAEPVKPAPASAVE